MNRAFLKFVLPVTFLGSLSLHAAEGPPPPTGTPLPGLPIDSNLLVLFFAIAIYSIFKIYKKQKTSI